MLRLRGPIAELLRLPARSAAGAAAARASASTPPASPPAAMGTTAGAPPPPPPLAARSTTGPRLQPGLRESASAVMSAGTARLDIFWAQ